MNRICSQDWISIWLAVGGLVAPLLLGWFGLFYGVFVENRRSSDGAHFSVYVALFALPVLQFWALAKGVEARKTTAGKAGILLAIAILLVYIGYFVRGWP